MPRSTLDDPVKVFRFTIELYGSGAQAAGFRSATGLEITLDSIDYRDSDRWDMVEKHEGLANSSNITLTRGQFFSTNAYASDGLRSWFAQVIPIGRAAGGPGWGAKGHTEIRRDLKLVQHSRDGAPVFEWIVHEAWPNRMKPFSDLDSLTSENSIEELELCNEGFELVKIGRHSGGYGASPPGVYS